ncbi:MAG: universal stress protein [Bacteroidota bacterium]|nr:universal stress protein [Bacteroidota bacterium]
MYAENETILIPVDFSDQSMIALEQSYNIAKYAKARIILLHVITGKLKNNDESLLLQENLDSLTDKLNRLSQMVTEVSGLWCSFMIEHGRIVPTILDVAKTTNARFIFIGSRKLSIGPITMRLIKEASCPVVSIKGKHHRHGCKRIILPLDLTKDTTKKVEMTAELAKYFNAEVKVVSAYSSNKDFKATKIRLLIEQVEVYFVNKSITCSTKLLDVGNKIENITKNLLDYADDVDGDLIVIMIQQEMQIKERIIGSLARKVIMGSNIPVLCLKPKFNKNKEEIKL